MLVYKLASRNLLIAFKPRSQGVDAMTKPPPQGPRGKLFGASAQGLEELELVLGRNGSVSDQVHDALRRAD